MQNKKESKQVGRKRIYEQQAMDAYTIRMTATHARIARKYGKNIGDGIRMALELLEETRNE